MSKRGVAWIICGIGVAGALLVLSKPYIGSSNDVSRKQAHQTVGIDSDDNARFDARNAVEREDCNQTDAPSARHERTVAQSKNLVKQREIALVSPEALVERLNVDPTANIALFEIASTCMNLARREGVQPQIADGCPNFDFSRVVDDHPIELVEKAAAMLGSSQAQLLFAMNAPVVAARYRRLNTNESVQRAAQLLKMAEFHGAQAARTGDLEAVRHIRDMYEHGLFGLPDYEKAYALALQAAATTQSNQDRGRVIHLGKKVNPTQRAEIDRYFSRCRSSTSEVMRNPFS